MESGIQQSLTGGNSLLQRMDWVRVKVRVELACTLLQVFRDSYQHTQQLTTENRRHTLLSDTVAGDWHVSICKYSGIHFNTLQQSTAGNRRHTYYEVRNNLYLWWHCWGGTLFILGVRMSWQEIRNHHYYLLMSWEHRRRKNLKKIYIIDCDNYCKYLALIYCAPPNIDRVKK